MIDIDHFNAVNDRFGHSSGDVAIRAVASVLSRNLRNNDLLGRVGGEEFAALLTQLDVDTTKNVALRLCQQVAEHCRVIVQQPLNLTISVGVVQVIPRQHCISAAFKIADHLLYESKRSGRNTVTHQSLLEQKSQTP
jgi:diguanylate cyclase (GGDEF)-like protein